MPLRPELYRRLCAAFDDHVAIANEGEEAVLRATLDGVTGKPMTKIEQPGEYLRVNDTERQPRAIFERQDGATGASRRGAHGAARTGGAARHAGPSAERG